MSIAADTLHAELTAELRRDLAATRLAWQREREAKEAAERKVERMERAFRTLTAKAVADRLWIENIAREVL